LVTCDASMVSAVQWRHQSLIYGRLNGGDTSQSSVYRTDLVPLCVCYTTVCAVYTDCPVGFVSVNFLSSDEVPDTSEPVSQHGEHGHQQCQHDDAVLIVAVEFLQQSSQPQQPRHLQHVDLSTLHNNNKQPGYRWQPRAMLPSVIGCYRSQSVSATKRQNNVHLYPIRDLEWPCFMLYISYKIGHGEWIYSGLCLSVWAIM